MGSIFGRRLLGRASISACRSSRCARKRFWSLLPPPSARPRRGFGAGSTISAGRSDLPGRRTRSSLRSPPGSRAPPIRRPDILDRGLMNLAPEPLVLAEPLLPEPLRPSHTVAGGLFMAFIETIPPEKAEGLLAELYAQDLRKHGFVPNYSQAWSLRPKVLEAWRRLLGAIRSSMDDRRYELVTILAAARLRCTY